jgi:hypothetical protein
VIQRSNVSKIENSLPTSNFLFSLRKFRETFLEFFFKEKKVPHSPKIKENLGGGGGEMTLKKNS